MSLLELLKISINTMCVKYASKEEIESFPIYYIGGSQVLPPPLSRRGRGNGT